MEIVLVIEFSDFLCEKCGECCRRCDPIRVSARDLENISGFLYISPYIVVANYTKQLKDGSFSLKAKPCIFLQGNQCTIYPARPMVCRAFPVTFKKDKTATLSLYDYCRFTENAMVQKAIGFLLRYLMDMDKPELSLALKTYMEQLEKRMPKDLPSQLPFLQKWIKEHKKKSINR